MTSPPPTLKKLLYSKLKLNPVAFKSNYLLYYAHGIHIIIIPCIIIVVLLLFESPKRLQI